MAFPKINKEMVKTNFFEYLDFSLQFAPPGPEEKEIRAKLASIGVGPGKTFNFKDLPLAHKVEVGLGMKDGEAKVDKYLSDEQKSINGWKVCRTFRRPRLLPWRLVAASSRCEGRNLRQR